MENRQNNGIPEGALVINDGSLDYAMKVAVPVIGLTRVVISPMLITSDASLDYTVPAVQGVSQGVGSVAGKSGQFIITNDASLDYA